MLGALTHAVVHMVALGSDDPVLPLDILELDVEVPLTAHGYIIAAAQRALPQHVFGVVVTETHLGHQEGLVGGVGGAIQGTEILPILITANLQPQTPFAPIQEGLQGASDGEGVPVTLLHLQHLFYDQGTARA